MPLRRENHTVASFRGLLYIKHGRVGTKSEGPDYWLQTFNAEYLLRFHERELFRPDFELEFHNRHIVEVQGDLDDNAIRVSAISTLPLSYIPRLDTRPHLGDALRLGLGERVALADAPVELALTGLNDSRCPIGAVCIRAGEAVLDLEVSIEQAAPQKIELTLKAGQPELAVAAVATVGAYRIDATRLDPYPTLSHSPVPEKSVATLVVTHAS